MDSGSPECNNLTIELTGALNGTQPLNINGNLVVNGSITTSNAISLYGSSMSGSGTITITDAAFYFQINDNENILLSSSLILNCDVHFMKNDLTVTNNGIITISGNISGNGFTGCQWINAINSVLYIGGNIGAGVTLDATATGNAVNYYSIIDQIILGTTYNNLNVLGAGNKLLAGNVTVNQDLNITGTNTTLDCGQYQITGNASGSFQMTTTLKLGNAGMATPVLFPTLFTRANIKLDAHSTVIYQSNGSQTISSVPEYGNLTTNTAGSKSLDGSVSLKGNLQIGAGTIFDVTTSNYGISLQGNWSNQGSFLSRNGTVSFTGTSVDAQYISNIAGDFYNLTISNSAGVTLINDAKISNLLTMTSGNIVTGTNTLILVPTSAGSLNYSSGTIVGRFRRGVDAGGDYLFPVGTLISPVGTLAYYRPASFNFSSLAAPVYITAEFTASAPGSFVPYSDGGVSVDNIFPGGYWHFSSSATQASAYSLSLTGNGFTGFIIDNNTRITGRNSVNTNWMAMGNHGSVTGTTITRTAISSNLDATSFDYSFAGSSCIALTASISPGSTSICSNTSPGTFTATGTGGNGTYTYLWYKNGASTGITAQTYNPGLLITSSTFYCAITSGICGTVNSGITTITVTGDLTAAISPGDVSICNNTSPGIFTATGGGGPGTYTYIWYKNGTSTGVTTPTYDPGPLTVTSTFYCAITVGTCTVFTSISTVTVASLGAVISPGNSTICINTSPGIFTATGSGGSGIYTYLWYKDGTSTGISTKTYDPGLLAATSTFYCVITDGSCGTANSNVTTITVSGDLTTVISPGNTSVCYNTSPGIFSATGSGGSGIYSYLWYKNGTSTGITTQTYDPGLLTATSTFYCVITSTTCSVNSSITTITVNSDLTAGISGGSSPICYNSSPGTFTATGAGGSGTYTFQWYSTSGIISGATSSTYTPVNLTVTIGYYCAITSGSCGTVNTTTTTITVFGNLTAGISGGTSPICYNTSPGTLTATGLGGTGIYTYQWYSTSGLISGATSSTYSPGSLITTTGYYCAITSGTCGTVNTATTTITVIGDLTAVISPGNTAICYNKSPGIFSATGGGGTGSYTYLWYKNGTSTGITTQTYDPGLLTATSTFYCVITSGTCSVNSPITTITVNSDLTAGITGGISPICYNTSPGTFTATGAGGNGTFTYQWYSTSGIINGATSSTYIPGNLTSTTGYYCAVTSGSCGTVNTTTTTITVYGNLTAGISGGSSPICYNTSPGTLTATGLGGTGIYTYQWYSTSGIIGGATSSTYSPGNLITTTGYYCAITSGSCGTINTSTTNITVNPPLVNPVLNIKSPNLPVVCDGQNVSATFNAGSGGEGCADVFQYRFDNSGTWTTYIPGSNISSSGHTLIEIQGQRSGCTGATGCTGSDWVNLVSWNINPQPVRPALNIKTPNIPVVCDGQFVSATFNPGSGGVGCTDAFQYRFDNSAVWSAYIPGNNISTTGHNSVEIQGQRAGCTAGAGCTGTAWATLVSWSINPQPVGPALNIKTPNLLTVCDGQNVSATFNSGSGGVGCTDAFQFRFDNTGTWTTYTTGANLSTSGHTHIEIQGQRTGCTSDAGCTGTAWATLVSWNINPQPAGPSLNIKMPNIPIVCDGQVVSATFNAGSGGVGCSDAFQYRFDNTGIWTNYTPGTDISTTGHTLIEIQGQRTGCTVLSGCSGTPWATVVSWNISPQPVGMTLNSKTPNMISICSGQDVSATFNSGSGGVGCTDSFQYRYDNTGLWTTYTPGNNISTTGHTLIEIQGQRSGCIAGGEGCYGTAWVTLVSWIINPQPSGPSLNNKIPNLATVCSGQDVSATFNPGSGGVGCTDAFQYRYDNSGLWVSYSPGSPITTTGHNSVEIQGLRSGCTAGAGCTGTEWASLVSWNINPVPVGPTLSNKIPNPAAVCSGQGVSATFNSGSGGAGCTDTYQYRFDNSGTWTAYTPGSTISTMGHNSVEIQGQRAGCTTGTGCSGTSWTTLASWNINPQPSGPDLNNKIPNLPVVCSGQNVAATFNSGSGGVGCSDVFQYRFDNTGSWAVYNPGDNISTTDHTLIEIQGSRAGCTAGAGCNGTAFVTLVSWSINPQPIGPSLNLKIPDLAAVCDRQNVSATFNPGSGGVGCTDAYQYRFDNSGTWTTYTPGASISTTGHTSLEIQGQRTGCTSGAGCNGTAWVTLVSWQVNPLPAGVSNPSSQVICSNLPITNIDLSTSNSLTGTTFAWSRDNNTNVTGVATSGTGSIGGTLRNLTGNNQPVIFTIIPTSVDGCNGDSFQATVTVRSEPVSVASSVNQITCSNVAITPILLSTSNGMNSVTTYGWSRDNNINVTGIPPAGAGNISGILNNVTDIFQAVKYTITPTSSAGCAGDAIEVNVTVNPVPRVIPVSTNLKPDTSICFGGNTSIRLTTPTVMTSGEIRFDYTVTAPGTITGNTTQELNVIPDYIINRSYQNSSDRIQSVYFNITPRVSNAICSAGNMVISEVKVHPQTIQYNLPLSESDLNGIEITKAFTCGGGSNASLRVYTSTDAGPYNFAWTRQTNDTIKIFNNPNINIHYSGRWDVIVTDNLGCKNSSSQWIQAATQFFSSLLVTSDPVTGYGTTCPGSNDGVISVKEGTSTQGIPPFEYWIPRSDQDESSVGVIHGILPGVEVWQTWNNLTPGRYRLILRDAAGCYNTDAPEEDIIAPDTISVVFDADLHSGIYNVSCKGYNNSHVWVNTIKGGNGGYTYQWFYDLALTNPIPGKTSDFVDGLVAGTYYLRITDRKGCQKTAPVTITEPEGIILKNSEVSLSAFGNKNISCNGGNDGYIKMTISGGSGNYTYLWTGPNGFTSTAEDISGLKAGVYTCAVHDVYGCSLLPSPSFTLTEPDPLTVSIDESLNVSCYGSATGKINTTVSGGSNAGYIFTWSTTDGSGILPGQKDQLALTAGSYKLVVKDQNNCEASVSVKLTQPDSLGLVLSSTNITCQSQGSINLAVTGGVKEYNYLWTGPNGFSATTRDIQGLVQGNYSVTVTDANGCKKTGSVTINSPPLLAYDKFLSDNRGYNISCYGLADGYIIISPTTGQAPFTYKWTGPAGFTSAANDISGLKAGNYTLIITDNNSCSSTEIIKLTEPDKLSMMFNLSTSISGDYNINCAGESTGSIDVVPVNPVGTVTYLWSDKNVSKSRTNLPAGNYSVTITDNNICSADSSVSLTQPDSLKLVFDIYKHPTCPDKPDGEIKLNVTGGVKGTDYLYKWSDNSTGNSVTDIPEGLIKVKVTDLNGCSLRDSVNVKALSKTCLSIPNAISPNHDGFNDVWNIGLTELYPNLEIKIFNRWGEIVWRSEKGYPRPWDGTSNGSPLPVDSYHYIIDLHNGSKPILGSVTILR